MKKNHTYNLLALTCATIMALGSSLVSGQIYKFKKYTLDDGIPQPFLYTITQDAKGYIWIGTGEGLSKYNGFRFKTMGEEDNVANPFVTTSLRDGQGNIWFGHNTGEISYFDGSTFTICSDSTLTSAITALTHAADGTIWGTTQSNGLIHLDKNNKVQVFGAMSYMMLFDLAVTDDGDLLLCADDGLYLFDAKTDSIGPEMLSQISQVPMTKMQCLERESGTRSFWVGTEDEGIHHLTIHSRDSIDAKKVGDEFGLGSANVQDLFHDGDHNLWICSFGNGLQKLIISRSTGKYVSRIDFSGSNALGSKFIKSIFEDVEGNKWIGTYGDGLARMRDDFFLFYFTEENQAYSNNVTAVHMERKYKWFGTENGLIQMRAYTDSVVNFYSEHNGLVNDKITALYSQGEYYLWIGTDQNGLFRLDVKQGIFKKIDLGESMLSRSVNQIVGTPEEIWVATRDGAFKLDKAGNKISQYTIDSGIRHNNINSIFADSKGDIWIGTHSNDISVIRGEKITHYTISKDNHILDINAMSEDRSGNIWIASYGSGIFRFNKHTITNFSQDSGLVSNYCYSIIVDNNDNVWVGHRGGLSKYEAEADIFKTYTADAGITSDLNANAMYSDLQGNLWFGTTMGAIKYDPGRDRINPIAPVTDIVRISISDKNVALTSSLNLGSGLYKVVFEFIGLSFKNTEEVTYQFMLEGYDLVWSDISHDGTALYSRLGDGQYKFKVRAANADGVWSTEPTVVTLTIAAPFWKEWWFSIALVALLAAIVYFIILLRERKLLQAQLQLAEILDRRTSEVVLQKEEIEAKNKIINDSIQYAKRIQTSVMPDPEELKEIFPQSFIFFQPRDVVSGDFYWFRKFGDVALVVCCDCTGHGVPGGFMSMIGSTILNEHVEEPTLQSPVDILNILDKEVKSLLKRNTHTRQTQYEYGMDISVAEINMKTNRVRIASAMRPVFIQQGEKLVQVTGDRISIAGGYTSNGKSFTMHTIDLAKGDAIYLFSDGYPDQFGGPLGKKLKIGGLVKILESQKNKPMREMEIKIGSSFNLWKEGHQQVDDILFMGIRL